MGVLAYFHVPHLKVVSFFGRVAKLASNPVSKKLTVCPLTRKTEYFCKKLAWLLENKTNKTVKLKTFEKLLMLKALKQSNVVFAVKFQYGG